MTKLLYMEGFNITTCKAEITKIEEFEGKTVFILDQTCFYAKGGGQDFDTGSISSEDGKTFSVEAVFFVDGEVKHIGTPENGEFKVGDKVACTVNEERRSLNTRIHSGGHVIDMALRASGIDWVAGKGAHYPEMAFVEYSGEYDGEKRDEYIKIIQDGVDKIIKNGTRNHIEFMTPEEMIKLGASVPENIPKDKPSRVMVYDEFAVPCGGTHVENSNEIGSLKILRMKKKGGAIRVSYSIE